MQQESKCQLVAPFRGNDAANVSEMCETFHVVNEIRVNVKYSFLSIRNFF